MMNSTTGLAMSYPDIAINGFPTPNYCINNYQSYIGYGHAARPSAQLQGYYPHPNVKSTPGHFGQGYTIGQDHKINQGHTIGQGHNNISSSRVYDTSVNYSRSVLSTSFHPSSYTVHTRPHMQWPRSVFMPQFMPQWPSSQMGANVHTFDQSMLQKPSAQPMAYAAVRPPLTPIIHSNAVATPSGAQMFRNNVSIYHTNYSNSYPDQRSQILPNFIQPPPVSYGSSHKFSWATNMQPLDLSTKNVTHRNNSAVMDHNCNGSYEHSPASNQINQVGNENSLVSNDNSPVCNQNRLVNYQNSLVMDQNSLVMDQNSPVSNENSTVMDQNGPVSNDNSPVCNQNHLVSNQNSFVMDQNSPISDTNSPVMNQNNPVSYQNSHAIDQKSPVINQNSPVSDENTHTIEQNSPLINQISPVSDENTPVIDQNTSIFDSCCSDNSTEYRLMRFCDCFKSKQSDCKECFFSYSDNDSDNTCLYTDIELRLENGIKEKLHDASHTSTANPTVDGSAHRNTAYSTVDNSAHRNTAYPTVDDSAHRNTAMPSLDGSNQTSAVIATNQSGDHKNKSSTVLHKAPDDEDTNSGQSNANIWLAQTIPSQPLRLILFKTLDEKSNTLGMVSAPVVPDSALSDGRFVEGKSFCEEPAMPYSTPLQLTQLDNTIDSSSGGLARHVHKLPPVIKRKRLSRKAVSKWLESSRVREVKNIRFEADMKSTTSAEESVLNLGSTQLKTDKRLKAVDVFESEGTMLQTHSVFNQTSSFQTGEPTEKKKSMKSILLNLKRKLLCSTPNISSFTNRTLVCEPEKTTVSKPVPNKRTLLCEPEKTSTGVTMSKPVPSKDKKIRSSKGKLSSTVMPTTCSKAHTRSILPKIHNTAGTNTVMPVMNNALGTNTVMTVKNNILGTNTDIQIMKNIAHTNVSLPSVCTVSMQTLAFLKPYSGIHPNTAMPNIYSYGPPIQKLDIPNTFSAPIQTLNLQNTFSYNATIQTQAIDNTDIAPMQTHHAQHT